jgi:hypothetical protein
MTHTATITISPTAGAAEMPELHAALMRAIEDGARIALRLERQDDVRPRLSPLALQLVFSARRTLPPGMLDLDAATVAALGRAEQPQCLPEED